MTAMKRISLGNKLYISVLSVFLLFAAAFIFFQQIREKQFKVDMLNARLQAYNVRMDDALRRSGGKSKAALAKYVGQHNAHGLRVTVMDLNGNVIYDNKGNAAKLGNHSSRPEVLQAIEKGSGSVVERSSKSVNSDFFYSATRFRNSGLIIRSALPYDNNLTKSLRADQHYLWFALTAIVILTFILYRFTSRIDANMSKLKIFASRAAHNESLDTEDLAEFSDDELGEIAERIIKIYKRLQTTRREQDMLKRELTQNIAHELKTPVASIQGYLETIISNPNINEATRMQFIQRSFAQSQRLNSLLHDISTLNRMDDAPSLVSFAVVDISAMVSAIVKETALQMQEKRMTFVNKLPSGIKVMGNYSLLYSVFRNLTDNAIAYAGEGTTVTLKGEDGGSEWRFTFSDNGVGVPSEHLPRLFERFYRIDKGRSRKLGGTGLGLAIVKNAVLLHGGTISVHNNIDGGLRFDFTISKTKATDRRRVE